MSDIFFSIVIPVYNAKKYLIDCIESVLNQNISNFEIILVNDGSTDESVAICEEYEKKHNKIVLINQTNQGVSAACNIGFKEAKGKYIIQIDNDDELIDDSLEKMQQAIYESNFPDILQCQYITEDKDISTLSPKYISRNNETTSLSSYESLFKNLYLGTLPGSFWSRAVKKEFIEKTNFEFDSNMDGIQDIDGTFKCFLATDNIVSYQLPMYIHKIRDQSLSMKPSIKLFKSQIFFCNKYRYEFDNKGISLTYKKMYDLWIEEFIYNIKWSIKVNFNKRQQKEIYRFIRDEAKNFNGKLKSNINYLNFTEICYKYFDTQLADILIRIVEKVARVI